MHNKQYSQAWGEVKMTNARESGTPTLGARSTAMAIANWFLEKSWQEPQHKHCDQMKLYKLCFYAHAWYLANKEQELFAEDVEAWPHGPVVRDLYLEFKRFGRNPITELGRRFKLDESGKGSWEVPKHDGSLDGFLEEIWSVYGNKTGIQLSNMTHRPGEPWTKIAEARDHDLSGKPSIPSDVIMQCFKEKMDAAQSH